MQDQRLCDAVGDEIADGNVDHKPQSASGRVAFVTKGEMLIQEEAEDAGEKVVCRCGNPIGTTGQIVQTEHDCHTNESVDNADDDESC